MTRSVKAKGQITPLQCRFLGVVMENCSKGLPVEEMKFFFLSWSSLLSRVLWIFPESSVGRWGRSPVRLHCDSYFMVSVILERGGERLTLKNSCAGGAVGRILIQKC